MSLYTIILKVEVKCTYKSLKNMLDMMPGIGTHNLPDTHTLHLDHTISNLPDLPNKDGMLNLFKIVENELMNLNLEDENLSVTGVEVTGFSMVYKQDEPTLKVGE